MLQSLRLRRIKVFQCVLIQDINSLFWFIKVVERSDTVIPFSRMLI